MKAYSDRTGFCYALRNRAFPHLIKLGATRAHPVRRARELGAGSGSPEAFEIVYYRDFEDCFAAETQLHRQFDAQRHNRSREFFEITPDEAIQAMDDLAGEDRLESQGITGGQQRSGSTVATPFAELFSSFKPSDDPYLNADERRQCRELAGRLAQQSRS